MPSTDGRGTRRQRKWLKTALAVIAGMAAAILFANFKTGDYRHQMLALKPGGGARPLSLNDYSGRQVIALSLRNFLPVTDLRLQGEGLTIQSWFPPPLPLPLGRRLMVADDPDGRGLRLRGVKTGQRLPLYLIVEGGGETACRELEILNGADGSLLQTVHLMPGDNDGDHH